MLSRRAPVGFVCLSCRLTNAVPVGSRFSLSVCHNALRRSYSDAISPAKFEQDLKNLTDDGEAFRRVNHKQKGKGKRQSFHRPRPQPEVYRSRGQRVRPKAEALSIDILGRPAHAIVMKDIGSSKNKYNIPQTEAENDSEPVNLSDVLKQQAGVSTSDEVLLNIHELRPSQSRPIPQRDFDSLRDVLVQGFTKAQLAAYMVRHQPETESPKAPHSSSGAPWVLEQWPWVPDAAVMGKVSDPVLDGYLHASMSPKDQLAVRLMRECWAVSTQEVENGQGYLDVRLRDLEFALLLIGNGQRLEDISHSLLAPGKQIEVIRPEKVVRIVASKPTAEVILGEINNVLGKLETRSIEVKLLSPGCLSPSSLEEVGRITNTVVQLDEPNQKILVHWIPPTEAGDVLENLGDVVFRLLLSASRHDYHAAGNITVVPEDDAKGGRFLVDYYSKKKWSWKDRTSQWARWVMATPRGAKPTGNEKLDNILAAFDSSTELEASQPRDESSLASTGWPGPLQRSTRAVFGHILHRYPPKHPGKLDLSQAAIISPVIPPLSSLAFPKAIQQPQSHPSSTILMRFLPDPEQDPALVSSAPPLELRLEASDTEVSGISSLRAITRATTHDILVPSGPVDVRLARSLFHELLGPAIAADPRHADPLLAFLEAADLRPSAGRLVTPARLRCVAVPIFGSGPGSAVQQPLLVDYLFAGLELRRSLAAEYDGWRLIYTTVEAGQGGGRRAELALEAVPASEVAAEGTLNKPHDTPAYLAVLARMALGGEFQWYGDNN